MKMINVLMQITVACYLLLMVVGCSEEHREKDTQNKHAGEVAGAHEGETAEAHAEHSDEILITLSEEGMELAGIATASVAQQSMATLLRFPGEVVLNEEQLVHIGPRYAGILKEATVMVGDSVTVGDHLATLENAENLSLFKVAAPLSGRVIEKHAARGEYITPESGMFVVADLRTVWINCAVNPMQALLVHKGQRAVVHALGSETKAEGVISYITPIIDPSTRTLTARIVLPNVRDQWRPGLFVTVTLTTQSKKPVLAVKRESVQTMGEKQIVFIPDGERTFTPVTVRTGAADDRYVELLSGLYQHDVYVTSGAFELKAQLVTSTLGAHAGHGH